MRKRLRPWDGYRASRSSRGLARSGCGNPGGRRGAGGPASLVAWGAMTALTLPWDSLGPALASLSRGRRRFHLRRKGFRPAASAVVGWTSCWPCRSGRRSSRWSGRVCGAAFGLPPRAVPLAVLFMLVVLSPYLGVGTVGGCRSRWWAASSPSCFWRSRRRSPASGRAVLPVCPPRRRRRGAGGGHLVLELRGWEAVGHFSGESAVPAATWSRVLWARLLVGLLYLGTAVAVVAPALTGGRTERRGAGDREGLGPAAGWLAACLPSGVPRPRERLVGGAANLSRSWRSPAWRRGGLAASHPSRGTPVGPSPSRARLRAGVSRCWGPASSPCATFSPYPPPLRRDLRPGRRRRRAPRRGSHHPPLALVALAASLLVYPFL